MAPQEIDDNDVRTFGTTTTNDSDDKPVILNSINVRLQTRLSGNSHAKFFTYIVVGWLDWENCIMPFTKITYILPKINSDALITYKFTM